jgi:hypothetical protein
VQLTRKRPSDTLNSIKIEVLDRTNFYNTAIVEAKDQALIETFGLRQSSSMQMHLFCDMNAARLSAQLQLQRQAIRNMYQFTFDQRYVLLDPMDIVTLTDSGLGLDRQWVRITEITENDDGSLSFVAEEYLDGTASAPLYSFQQGLGFSGGYNADPGNSNAPVIFELTAMLAENLEVWLATSGGPLWGGCDVFLSNDGNSYRNIGRITGSARTGVLAAPLVAYARAATGPTIDASDTLAVDLSQSDGQLLSGTQSDALSLATLCYVDGEYIAYENAVLTGADSYSLTWLVRGAYGTMPVAHPQGGLFARIDNGIYWVGVYSLPLAGLHLYSPLPPDLSIMGAQITSNVIASYDEAATGWTGVISGDAIVSGGMVRTGGSGNILAIADFLNTPDILNYGGIGNGIYTIPAGHIVNIGRVAPCSIIVNWVSVGQHISDNILGVLDYLNFPDLLDFAASGNTDVYPEIALSQDGTTWGAWQRYSPGFYQAMAFTARMQLQTLDPTVEAILQGFVFEVDVPDRDDHYVGLSIPSGGLNLVFTPDGAASSALFNGGPAGSPAAPHIQVTVLAAIAGDLVSITSVTLSGCSVQVLNGGVGVVRSVNILAQGY